MSGRIAPRAPYRSSTQVLGLQPFSWPPSLLKPRRIMRLQERRPDTQTAHLTVGHAALIR